jgi:membrane protease YdiL (CAAX protease family)
VHLPSGNFMLIMAAMVCGIVWGGLYWLMPKNLKAIIISHALWDAAAFVWLPF